MNCKLKSVWQKRVANNRAPWPSWLVTIQGWHIYVRLATSAKKTLLFALRVACGGWLWGFNGTFLIIFFLFIFQVFWMQTLMAKVGIQLIWEYLIRFVTLNFENDFLIQTNHFVVCIAFSENNTLIIGTKNH